MHWLLYCAPPFPSHRHHRSNGDRLQGKRENYQVCSVEYCVQQLYSELHTHINRTNSSLDWVLSHWAHFTVLRFIFVYVLFCVWLYIVGMCSIVTWWSGLGVIEAWSLGPLLPSVRWHCRLGHLTRKKLVTDMTYNVFSGTLNPTQSFSAVHVIGTEISKWPAVQSWLYLISSLPVKASQWKNSCTVKHTCYAA